MGKQEGAAFGLGEKGRISISVKKPSYIAGEIVFGMIYLEVYEPIQCKSLAINATGNEKAKWRESCTERDSDGSAITRYKDHEAKKEFFKKKIVIKVKSQVYTPGNYMIPFQYQLPVELPGVFHLENYSSGSVDDLKAKIKYKLEATLAARGYSSSDLKADCNMVVHECNLQEIRPSEGSITQNVKFLCCFKEGNCQLAVAMDKNVFLAGEIAQIQCQINNRSTMNTAAMRCHLYQDIRVRRKHDRFREFSRELAVCAFPGVPAQTLVIATDHNVFLNPSTSGNLIQCSYRISIECDIRWCPDVVLHLPVALIAREIPNKYI